MRADRLLSILLLLQNHGKMTSRQLAEKLEVSERTIIRDMEALSIAGVPVFAERGVNGGWSLAETYRTNLTGMKPEEILSLLISNQTTLLHDLGIQKHFDAAFQKLLASTPQTIRQNAEAVRQKIHIDGAGWHQSNESYPYLSIVQEAVWEERKLCIHYQREKEIVERTVCPLGLVAKRSIWYLVAEIDGDLRTYRISRFVHAQILAESFDPPSDFDLAQYWEKSMEQFKLTLPRYPAKIKMSAPLLPRFEQERYTKIVHIEATEQEWLEVDIQFETLDSACEIILGFGSLVEVLAPEELRTKVISEAKAIVKRYNCQQNNCQEI